MATSTTKLWTSIMDDQDRWSGSYWVLVVQEIITNKKRRCGYGSIHVNTLYSSCSHVWGYWHWPIQPCLAEPETPKQGNDISPSGLKGSSGKVAFKRPGDGLENPWLRLVVRVVGVVKSMPEFQQFLSRHVSHGLKLWVSWSCIHRMEFNITVGYVPK